MGIPSYFSYLVKSHRTIIRRYDDKNMMVNNLFLDCNSIVYDVLRAVPMKDVTKDEFERNLILAVCKKIHESL